jgi:hypothetical protein
MSIKNSDESAVCALAPAGFGQLWDGFRPRRGTGENGVKLGIFNGLMINFVGSSYMRLDPG